MPQYPRDYQEFLQSLERQRSFMVSDGVHFFVHFPDADLTPDSLRERTKARCAELWLAEPLLAARMRIALYAHEKADDLPSNIELLQAVTEGLRHGGLISRDSFIWRTWIDYDFHKELPYPVLSIYVGWSF